MAYEDVRFWISSKMCVDSSLVALSTGPSWSGYKESSSRSISTVRTTQSHHSTAANYVPF